MRDDHPYWYSPRAAMTSIATATVEAVDAMMTIAVCSEANVNNDEQSGSTSMTNP